jgi:GH24 family phage-related lysozyme (muramidase)
MASNIKKKNFTAVSDALANGIATSKGKFVPGLGVRRKEEALLFSK